MWVNDYHRRLGIGREPGATQPPLHVCERGYGIIAEATTDSPEDMARRIDFLDRAIAHLIGLGADPVRAAYVMAEAIPLLTAGRSASSTVKETTDHLLTYLPHLLIRTNLQDAVNAITRQAGVDMTTEPQWLLQKHNMLWVADYASQATLIAREQAAEAARLKEENDERALQAASWEAEAYARAQAAETARLAAEAEALRIAEVARIQAEEEAARQASEARAAQEEQLRLQSEAEAARLRDEEAEAQRLEQEAELASNAASEAQAASLQATQDAQAISDQQEALKAAQDSEQPGRADDATLQTMLAVDQAIKSGSSTLPLVDLPMPGEAVKPKKIPIWVYVLAGAGLYYLMSDQENTRKSHA